MELLAPAGNWDAFLAALKNGADAVYLGGQQYSARQSAANFDLAQLREAVVYAHLRDKKVYVTVNTLIDNSEFSEALDYLFRLQELQVDAVIIQDMGLLQAARMALPDLRLHASTQMTIHNQDGAKFLHQQGVKRIVLARELSGTEIKAINVEAPEVELEVFVHGALCFCYSGQCLFSSMVGGRSGNRGRCAQPCRLPYELYRQDGQAIALLPDQGKYLLSPADLCLIENLPELKASGVSSLKIEGRMKRAEYVAVVTRAYREAIDRLQSEPDFRPDKAVKDRLLRIFNRNFSGGYFMPGNVEFLSTKRPNNRGVYVGRVVEQDWNLLTRIKLSDTVSQGDGLVVWVGQGKVPAVVVKEMKREGHSVVEAHSGETIEVKMEGRVAAHDRVFKTHDEKLLADAQASIRSEIGSQIPVDAHIYLSAGQTMRLVLSDRRGYQAEVETRNLAEPADQHPVEIEILRQKLSRLGNTPFVLGEIKLHGDTNLMIPFSDINDARRRAVDILIEKILQAKQPLRLDPQVYWEGKNRYLQIAPAEDKVAGPRLAVTVSGIEQAQIASDSGADLVYLGMEGIGVRRHLQQDQIDQLLALSPGQCEHIIPLLPRIRKPGEPYPYRQIAEAGFSNVMISSWADLEWALHSGLKVRADYSLNIFNAYTLRYLSHRGLSAACLSPELNFAQLQSFPDLSQAELLVHGEIILMQSEYCMLGRVLGGEKKNCMTPCVSNSYYIKDNKGYEFPLETDADCRFYVFNSRTLSMMEDLARVIDLGPASIRIEARRLKGAGLARTVQIYRQAVDEYRDGSRPDLRGYQEELSAISSSAFTKGHYYRGVL